MYIYKTDRKGFTEEVLSEKRLKKGKNQVLDVHKNRLRQFKSRLKY